MERSISNRRRYLTADELERLIKAARKGRYGRRDATLMLIMARHGLRVTEAIDLRWDQIDFSKGHLHVRRLKGGIHSVHPIQGDYAQDAAPALHVSLQSEEVTESKDFERAFDNMVREHTDALFVLSDSLMSSNRVTLAQLAADRRIPTLNGHNLYTEAGGLMSYGPSVYDLIWGAASYVDKILRGAKPADLPVQQPVEFELIINLTTAKALGLTLPPSLLARADKVIE